MLYIFIILCVLLLAEVFLLLFVLRSVYCLCVNVYCTTATGCQPNCSYIYIYIYIYIYHIIYAGDSADPQFFVLLSIRQHSGHVPSDIV
jgi:hypothetical protein